MAGKTNLELLTRDENRIEPLLKPIWNPLACAFIAGMGTLGLRVLQKRPIWSGIQVHVGSISIGGILGYYIDRYRDAYLAERDAVLRHYLLLHPEDFPETERRKFSEVFQKWIPVR